ncbi:hypothetical protein UFOVP587_11 [uncultured Caudovirales phage]|uniref:Uncharacterized protein n=1 Tax=uncultured Caudovirales phage TaxID=2100421 RepID=A0A6J5MZD7_9CAUD|nr:hypothetical protein UFOVP587_11 [uncultured Caudovirales phage]
MASRKKPEIGFGPIKDDLAKLLTKALSGQLGKTKKSQGRRIITVLEKRNPVLRSAGNSSVQNVKTKASKLERAFVKSKVARDDRAKTAKMADTFSKSQSGKGLNWDGSLNKASKAKVAAEKKAQAEVESRAKKAAIIKKADRQMSKAEVEAAKGTGRYVSPSSGKVTYVGPKRAGVGRSKAGAIPAQMGKNFKNQAEVQAGLRDAFKKATTKEARLKAARALRKHQGDYGTFGK